MLIGGKIEVSVLQDMLRASYLPKNDREERIKGYEIDKPLNSKYVAVYYDDANNHCVISIRGTAKTMSDWSYNGVYALQGQDRYKTTKRAKAMEPFVKKAIEKYGGNNCTIIGHSQGAIYTRMNSDKVNDTVTVNPAARFESQKSNEYTIRSSMDVVSSAQALGNSVNRILYPQFNKKRNIEIPSTTSNPLTEHSYDILERLPPTKKIGKNKR